MLSSFSCRAQTKPHADCYRQNCFRRFHGFTLLPYEKAVQRFSITLLSLNDLRPFGDRSQNTRSECKVCGRNSACQRLRFCNDSLISFKEVRAAVGYRGCNEVDGPQPGGAGCGRCFTPSAETLCLADNKSSPNSPP